MKRGARFNAIKNGEKRYISETPCKMGHLGERVTSTGTCIQCRQIRAREKYYANPQEAVAKVRKYYQENAELIKEKRRKSYAKNPEKELVTSRIRVAEWRKNNPEKVKAQNSLKSDWKKKNPHNNAALLAKRRAAKMQRTPHWLSEDDKWMMEQAYELAALRKKMFGFAWHVDHIVPLQGKTVSGLHVPQNLQVIPWVDNLAKSNKFM